MEEKLAKIKERFSLKNKEIGKLVGVTQGFISLVLTGRKKPSPAFIPLFSLWDYFCLVEQAVGGAEYLASVFPGLGLKMGGGIVSFFEGVEFLRGEIGRIEREVKEKGRIPEEVIERGLLKDLSFFNESSVCLKQKEWTYSDMKEGKFFCSRLQVNINGSFIMEHLSTTTSFVLKGGIRDLLCLCLAYRFGLAEIDSSFGFCEDFIVYNSVRICFEKEDFVVLKDIFEDFMKKKKISFSYFVNLSRMIATSQQGS